MARCTSTDVSDIVPLVRQGFCSFMMPSIPLNSAVKTPYGRFLLGSRSGVKELSKTGATPQDESVSQRRLSRAGADTRDKTLNAAERLFADHGYDGTSLRDISEASGLHITLTSYHFGTKERLFEEVIRRRAEEVVALRMAALEKIDPATLPAAQAVRRLIEGYSLPMIQARYEGSKQWQAHVRLMSQLISVQRWVPLIQKYYDATGQAYLEKFRIALPNAENPALLDAFSFMVATMLYVCSYPDRFAKMKTKVLPKKQEIAAAVDHFVQFVHAGFMALR
jgi:AcrR family transcriptional regulator